ncbi:MAG: thiol peroxidase [Kiritimatiellaceae bacterium]|nr:thiol peroxidase [Kiritimatiellaceae bacterium]
MAQVTFKGSPVQTAGELPSTGSAAPDFTLVKQDLSDATLGSYVGKKLVLNIFPSIDTSVCALSVKAFNAEAAALENTAVVCVSVDLPFAHARFCGAEGIDGVETASAFRSDFGEQYGVTMTDSVLAGLFARAIVVIDEAGKVIYTELVPEIAQEPDYDAVFAALK